MNEDLKPMPGTDLQTGSATPQPSMPQIAMDAADLSTVYTNFCHVTFTPEELILDFGLNTQTPPTPSHPIKLSHRVVMNFYTVKRLMQGLHHAVSRYESLFGPLELDVQRRISPMINRKP